MSDSDWWARRLGRAPSQPAQPPRSSTPRQPPVFTPQGVQDPQTTPAPAQQHLDVDEAGQVHAGEAWQAWRGKEGVKELETLGGCPECGSANFFARSQGVLRGPPPAPHCLAGETRVLTYEGVQTLQEMAGTTQRLLTTNKGAISSRWVDAEVKSFGVQPLMEVCLSRNGVKKTLYATDQHRWMVRMSAKEGRRVVERLSKDLLPGHRLAYVFPESRLARMTPSPIGVAHGMTFGDGSLASKGGSAYVNLWGDKDRQMLQYFPCPRVQPLVLDSGVTGLSVRDLPRYFKNLPSMQESAAYLYGWLVGLFAADGSVSETGSIRLNSARREVLEFVRGLSTRLGIGTRGIGQQKRQGYGDEPLLIYHLEFFGSTLLPDFFAIEQHRLRYVSSRTLGYRWERPGWSVESVSPTDRLEEVFCAVVPETHTFALEDNILIGNCYDCGYPLIQAGSGMGDLAGAKSVGTGVAPQPKGYELGSGGFQIIGRVT